MLVRMGFDSDWVNLIMKCVTTVRYHILIDGSLTKRITPPEALDKVIPYPLICLFFAQKAFLFFCRMQTKRRSLHGIRVARGAPPVSHLFFPDESLLLFKASSEEARVVMSCLNAYEKASGQTINFHKSCIVYNKNTQSSICQEVSSSFGVKESMDFGKYMGAPFFHWPKQEGSILFYITKSSPTDLWM